MARQALCRLGDVDDWAERTDEMKAVEADEPTKTYPLLEAEPEREPREPLLHAMRDEPGAMARFVGEWVLIVLFVVIGLWMMFGLAAAAYFVVARLP